MQVRKFYLFLFLFCAYNYASTKIYYFFQCGPCRAFTPELVNTYNTINETDKKFEIIYVSSDSDEDTFKEYYGEMPWLAIKFEDGRKKKMSHLFDVSGTQ